MARKKFDDVFDPFVQQTLDSFGYLTRAFGFEHYKTEVVGYECSIAFRKNDSVAVHVTYEAGSLPWVMLFGRTARRVDEADLVFVIRELCPDREPDLNYRFPASEQQVKELVRDYASILRECARDFLEGDPSVLEAVRPAVASDWRRARREMWSEGRELPAVDEAAGEGLASRARLRGDVRSAFEQAAELLDAGLDALRRESSDRPLRTWDHSNRSGGGTHGGRYYGWAFTIFRDSEREGRIRRSAVEVSYVEPEEAESARTLHVRIQAEIFRMGALSDVEHTIEQRVPLADLASPEAVARLFRTALDRADARLARMR